MLHRAYSVIMFSYDDAHIELVVTFLAVNIFSFLILIFRGGGVTTCTFDRIFLLSILYLPTPIRTRNMSKRPCFWAEFPVTAN